MKSTAHCYLTLGLALGLTASWAASAATSTAVFTETMGATAAKPWTGSGCNNAWTVTFNGGSPFEQALNANYGSGNPCGLTFKGGTANLSDSMITTTAGINAQGASGTLTFYMEADSLAAGGGWVMQLNAGAGFTNRLSELTASNHAFQAYSYTLQAAELVNNLTLRFQFRGGYPTNRIMLDDIVLTVVSGTNSSATVTLTNLPDTGQVTSYTSTFGEDSDYAIHPPAYLNNGDGTISDKVTGLMWQQTDGGEMTWESATNYPATLTLGSCSDWRLPTSQELYSLTLQNGFSPAINTNSFTPTAAAYWWTRDPQLGNATNIWVVSSGGSIGPQPRSATLSAGGAVRIHVRCVRGAAAISPTGPIHHFANNGNGTITDTDTGLMWQQAEIAATTNWEGALQLAGTLTLAGFTDWRLPNIKELQSISDETLAGPSVDTRYFPNAAAARYWSSTTVPVMTNLAWCLDYQYGMATNTAKSSTLWVRCVRGGTTNITGSFAAQYVRIPGGGFVMGDHFNFYDPDHPSDEIPLHNVYITPLYMTTTLATMTEYCAFLNAALYQGLVEVRSNLVYAVGGTNIYLYTHDANAYSFIQWTNNAFVVMNNRDLRPVTSVLWYGAIAYCNWLSQRGEFKPCYNLDTGDVDFTKNGFRLPTEAEWEYCAHGGLTNPYCMFPWGTNSNASGTFANWQGSGDPFESTNDYPNTTPVGFYNGALRFATNYNWPGSQTSYQTSDGSNPFGLYDMAGDVWEWCNDWYQSSYYSYCVSNNIVTNPPGPVSGDIFTDHGGLAYRTFRGGTWWNGGGQQFYGYSRVSNRDPAWSLGTSPDGNQDSTWFQVGFRVMRPEKLTQTVGLFLNATNASPGYTLMSPMQGTNAYLLNDAGQYVHKWTSAYCPGRGDYLMTNGHYFRECSVQTILSTGGGEGGRHEERDWEGNLLWAFDLNTATNMSHHDFKVLPNGNLIMIVCEYKSLAEVIAAGFNPNLCVSAITTSGGFMLPDYIAEVQPTRPYGGKIVWEWHTWDHLIQDYDPTKHNYGVVSSNVGLVNANPPSGQNQQFWNHFNGIDYNPQFDQILISCRCNSEIWVIDHSTTTAQAASHAGGTYGKGGDLLYRWGNPQQYKLGTPASEMLWQQHCCIWIPTNCPGAGHILIFNNGNGGRGYSSVDEIVPPVDAYGNYSRSTGAAFGPAGLYWTYTNNPATNFYCSDIGGAEREPNGNTLITHGTHGTVFEVTTDGTMVWNYINPEIVAPLAQGSAIPPDAHMAGQWYNEVFKVHRYPTNYAGLANKDLTPRGTVETYTGAATDTVGLGLPDLWVRSHFGSLSAVTATSSHSGNGLTDLQEYQYGLDPTLWSSANDGIPDGWAMTYGFDPTLATTASLVDANGLTTLQNYTADLNPTNATAELAISSIATGGSDVKLTWVGGVNAWQYLECSPSLLAAQWTAVFTNTPPTGITNSFTHPGAAAGTNLFYRIRAHR